MKKSGKLFGIVLVLMVILCLIPAVSAGAHSAMQTNLLSSKDTANSPVLLSNPDTEKVRLEAYRHDWSYRFNRPANIPGETFFTGVARRPGIIFPGNVPVPDSSRILTETGANDSYLFQWAVPSHVGVKYPTGVAVDSAGDVYVIDGDNHSVWKFTSTGTYITQWGSYGSEDGQFIPEGIAVDSSGNVYVSDTGNDRIQKFKKV